METNSSDFSIDVDVNTFSVSSLNYTREVIEAMNKFNQIEILRILNNHGEITLNENK